MNHATLESLHGMSWPVNVPPTNDPWPWVKFSVVAAAPVSVTIRDQHNAEILTVAPTMLVEFALRLVAGSAFHVAIHNGNSASVSVSWRAHYERTVGGHLGCAPVATLVALALLVVAYISSIGSPIITPGAGAELGAREGEATIGAR